MRIYCLIGKNPGFLLNNLVLDIIALIPRIIPYSSKYIKKSKIREIKFEKNDGLTEFHSEIPYLETDYNKILTENKQALINIKLLRNKIEHKMHVVKSEGNVIDTDINSEQIFATGFTSEEAGDEIKISVQSSELIRRLAKQGIF